jgi:hypothetical protein
MTRIVNGSIALLLLAVSATCAARATQVDTGGGKGLQQLRSGSHPVQGKIVLKRDPADATKCVARTMPKRMEIDPDEDDGVIWVIRQQPGSKCLSSGVDLELRWVGQNPTACGKLGTHVSGNKTRFECDLDLFVPGKTYTYKLYRVGGGLDEMVEDPEIEIVVF